MPAVAPVAGLRQAQTPRGESRRILGTGMTWIRIKLILTSKEVLSVKGENLLFFVYAGFHPAGSQLPHPPCPKEDLRPLPKPLANLWQGDVIDSGQGPPCVKVLVRFAKPVPYGRTLGFYRLRWTLVD